MKYLQREIDQVRDELTEKQHKYFEKFRTNLLNGIKYYEDLIPALNEHRLPNMETFMADLQRHANTLKALIIPTPVPVGGRSDRIQEVEPDRTANAERAINSK